MDLYLTRLTANGIQWITDCPWGADPISLQDAWALVLCNRYRFWINPKIIGWMRENRKAA
jgi:hypothetical protein